MNLKIEKEDLLVKFPFRLTVIGQMGSGKV